MQKNGYFIAGQITRELEPVILNDEFGEVHFHLVPFADPSVIKHLHDDETITNHQEAMRKITADIQEKMDDGRTAAVVPLKPAMINFAPYRTLTRSPSAN